MTNRNRHPPPTLRHSNGLKAHQVSAQSDSTREHDSEGCYHCGQALEQVIEHADHRFCCLGCRAAWELITKNGLGSYYRHRETFGAQPSNDEMSARILGWQQLEQALPSKNGAFKEGHFFIRNLHCSSCAWLSEKVLASLEGVDDIQLDYGSGRLFLRFDSTKLKLEVAGSTLFRLGYSLTADSAPAAALDTGSSQLKRWAAAGFGAGNNMLISISLYAGFFSGMERATKDFLHYLSFLFASLVFFYSLRPILRAGYSALKHRLITVDSLLSLALSLAYGYSFLRLMNVIGQGEVYFDSITFVGFVVLTARLLEDRLRAKSQLLLNRLLSNLPGVVHQLTPQGELVELPLADVQPGMLIRIFPGELIPVDGRLTTICEVDEGILSGEYLPKTYAAGHPVSAGSRPVGAPITIEVTSDANTSSLHNLRQNIAAGFQKLHGPDGKILRAGMIFSVLIIVLGAVTFGYQYFAQGTGLGQAVYHTVTLLIVACPCALSLAYPAAMSAAYQSALAQGIIIRSPGALHRLSTITSLLLDKTGTLTSPEMVLVGLRSAETGEEAEGHFLDWAVALQNSLRPVHPISRAFLRIKSSASEVSVEQAYYIAGAGLVGRLTDRSGQVRTVFLGRPGLEPDATGLAARPGRHPQKFTISAHGVSVVLSVSDSAGRFIPQCYFEFEDELWPDAGETIASLKKRYPITILSGDRPEAVGRWARDLGLADYHAALSPTQKQDFVAAQRRAGYRVLMLGDGLNDCQALSNADVGVSFSSASQLTMHSCDVLFLEPGLKRLDSVLTLSNRLRRVLIQNFGFAILYNLLLIPLALQGMLIPMVGALAMSSSSVVVTLNSLRLLRRKETQEKYKQ